MPRVSSFENENENDFDVSEFTVKDRAEVQKGPDRSKIDQAAKESGFSRSISEKPKKVEKRITKPTEHQVVKRKYRTGRSQQFNMRARMEDKNRFNTLCNEHDWVQGQALQYALDALEEKISNPNSGFWNNRSFRGSDNT